MPTLYLTPASDQDLATIREIAHRSWPSAYGKILSDTQLAYMLDLMYSMKALELQRDQGHRFMLIKLDGEAVGFASYEHKHGGTRTTRLHKLYVLPDRHGLGLGAALLEGVIDAARAAAAETIELNVNRHNPAIGFYIRKGFLFLREEVIQIGGGYVMDDFVLHLRVS